MKKKSLSKGQVGIPLADDLQFKNFADNISDWVWVLSPDGSYVYSNPRVLDILGYEPMEIIGRTPFDFMPEEESISAKKRFFDIVPSKKTFSNMESICFHRDGRMVFLESNGVPSFDPNGNLLGYSGIHRDITGYKKNASLQQRTKRFKSLSTLAGGMAHELNNALHVLKGHVEMLEEDLRYHERVKIFKSATDSSIKRLCNLSNQLLRFAREGQYNFNPLALNNFIKHEISWLQKEKLCSNIHLTTIFCPNSACILADASQLAVAISAILTNAVEALQGGGQIQVCTGMERIDLEMALKYPGLKPGNYASLSIADDGQGMDTETKQRLFEPFFTTKFQGRGLGMAAAFGIIKSHNGFIYAESEKDKGTIIRIFLPALADE